MIAVINNLPLEEYTKIVRDCEQKEITLRESSKQIKAVEDLIVNAMNQQLEGGHADWMRLAEIRVSELCRAIGLDYEVLEEQLISVYKNKNEGYQE